MIDLLNINKTYCSDNVETEALRNVTLHVNKGDFIGIIGTSGSGKTTLLNILGAMDKPNDGTYLFNNVDITKLKKKEFNEFRKQHIGFVFQHFELMEQYSVYENVEMPLLARGEKNRKEKVMEYLKLMHIEDLAKKRASRLSGGQKQRCAIARALVSDADVILADEPTGALDKKTTQEIMEVFCDVHKLGKTIILITHDQMVADYCERIIRIEDGELMEE